MCPRPARKSDCFLHYLYVTNPTVASAPTVTLKETTDKVTVEFGADGPPVRHLQQNGATRRSGDVRRSRPGGKPTRKQASGYQRSPQRFDGDAIWEPSSSY